MDQNNLERHPEQRPGEMFLANSDQFGYEGLGWRTKRKGKVAYDVCGREISQARRARPLFPVFISQAEHDAAAANTERRRAAHRRRTAA